MFNGRDPHFRRRLSRKMADDGVIRLRCAGCPNDLLRCAIENLADCFAGVRDGMIGAAAKTMRTDGLPTIFSTASSHALRAALQSGAVAL